MAHTSGTATDHADLLNKLNTYLTVTLGTPWTSKRAVSGSEMIWQAPGGGSDEIIVGAKVFTSVPGDFYNWRLGGFQNYDAALAFEAQSGYVGAAAPSPVFTLTNGSIPYRFYASGSRVIVLAKISSVYVVAYLGFLSSYMSPGAFPYPLVVGGNLAFDTPEPGANDVLWRWSNSGDENSNFPIPLAGTSGGTSGDWQSSLRLRLATGSWRGFNVNPVGTTRGRTYPHSAIQGGTADWRTNLDGSYEVFPIVLADASPSSEVYGELDGIVAVTGFGNSAESTLTIGSDTYYVVPNVFRGGVADYFAIKEA